MADLGGGGGGGVRGVQMHPLSAQLSKGSLCSIRNSIPN